MEKGAKKTKQIMENGKEKEKNRKKKKNKKNKG